MHARLPSCRDHVLSHDVRQSSGLEGLVRELMAGVHLEDDLSDRRREVDHEMPVLENREDPVRLRRFGEADPAPAELQQSSGSGARPQLDRDRMREAQPKITQIELGRQSGLGGEGVESVDPIDQVLDREKAGDAVLVLLALNQRGIVVEPAETERPPPGGCQISRRIGSSPTSSSNLSARLSRTSSTWSIGRGG